MQEKYSYVTKQFCELTDKEICQCSNLFSNYYGIYSGIDDETKKGEKIKMSAAMYHRTYDDIPETYVSLCINEDEIIGQVFFLLGELNCGKKYCWVTQLVVDEHYRRQHIGYNLLASAWCFSDIDIRGLATANAITLKILESVTWRENDKNAILSHMDDVRDLLIRIPFMSFEDLRVSEKHSQIFSNFYPEPEAVNQEKGFVQYTNEFGQIEPGCEWISLIFNDQKLHYQKANLDKYLRFSESQLIDAYDRMDLGNQPWARGAREEMTWLFNYLKNSLNKKIHSDMSVLDIGCGIGRHSLELEKLGIKNLKGIDFASSQISLANQSAEGCNSNIEFVVADARNYSDGKKYDIVLCLYDVIGSFRSKADNVSIIKTIYKCLKYTGTAVISVMNSNSIFIPQESRISVSRNPEAIINLVPSKAMSRSGEIFDSSVIFNEDDDLFYRKEQFSTPGKIFAEYLIASKRYSKPEIIKLLSKNGLKVIKSFYASSGKWSDSAIHEDSSRKEIVCIVRKKIFGFF